MPSPRSPTQGTNPQKAKEPMENLIIFLIVITIGLLAASIFTIAVQNQRQQQIETEMEGTNDQPDL